MKDIVSGISQSYSNSGLAAEETLRVIASLPAPEGLEQRVRTKAGSAGQGARIVLWPTSSLTATGMAGSWMRGAAAAAIVIVVAGGGWGVYSRVQAPQTLRELAMPPHFGPSGGFSSAGAMRTPETLAAPVLLHAQKPEIAAAQKAVPPRKTVHPLRPAAKPVHGMAAPQ